MARLTTFPVLINFGQVDHVFPLSDAWIAWIGYIDGLLATFPGGGGQVFFWPSGSMSSLSMSPRRNSPVFGALTQEIRSTILCYTPFLDVCGLQVCNEQSEGIIVVLVMVVDDSGSAVVVLVLVVDGSAL